MKTKKTSIVSFWTTWCTIFQKLQRNSVEKYGNSLGGSNVSHRKIIFMRKKFHLRRKSVRKWKNGECFTVLQMQHIYESAYGTSSEHQNEVWVKNGVYRPGKIAGHNNNGGKKSFMIKFLIYVIESFKYRIANKYGLHFWVHTHTHMCSHVRCEHFIV